MIPYRIISTGSQGNAVIVNDFVLIDCGVPYKSLAKYVPRLKLVLLMKTFFGRKYVKEIDLEKFRVHIAWNGVLQLLE